MSIFVYKSKNSHPNERNQGSAICDPKISEISDSIQIMLEANAYPRSRIFEISPKSKSEVLKINNH